MIDGTLSCLLVQVIHTGATPALVRIIENNQIVKCGVRILGDMNKLTRDYEVDISEQNEPGTKVHIQDTDVNESAVTKSEDISFASPVRTSSSNSLTRKLIPSGYVDLAEMLVQRCPTRPASLTLDSVCQIVLLRSLDKAKAVRMSNWEKVPLSEPQKRYAAIDAYAGYALYNRLLTMPIVTPVSFSAKWTSDNGTANSDRLVEGDLTNGSTNTRTTVATAVAFTSDAALASIESGFSNLSVSPTSSVTTTIMPPASSQPQAYTLATPSKMHAFRLFFHEGLTLDQIAEIKNIKPATAETYIADIMTYGEVEVTREMMDRLGVTDGMRIAVIGVLGDAEKMPLKEIKQLVPPEITYGQIRYVLAERAFNRQKQTQEGR
jgi:hypothetical protein